ncbi:MAG: type IV pilus biogenesis protein PilM [Vicinamibacterales bacterium]
MKYPDFLMAAPVAAAISIEAGRVTAVSAAKGPRGPVVAGYATEPLAPGVVVPALAAANIADRAALSGAIDAVLRRLQPRPKRVALVLPDMVGKVSIVHFDAVPARRPDLDQMVRFQVRKTAPFKIEEAQVAWTAGSATAGGGRDFVTVVSRRDVIAEYETACLEAGVHAGIVDLATLNVINLVLASAARPQGDWLLVHVAADYTTIAIMRGPDVIFFRNRADETEGNLAELVRQTAMYYEDRLGGKGFERVMLSGASAAPDRSAARDFHADLESRLGLEVTPLDPSSLATFSDRISVDAAFFAGVAPLVGVLRREWAAA